MANTDWDGATRRSTFKESFLAARDALADAARDGDWDTVLAEPGSVNAWRPGGSSWYTPVHHAAWHGADDAVVQRLLRHGAWLTLRTAAGDRPLDIALRGGHRHLAGPLTPTIHHPVPTDVLAALQRHFHALVRERAAELVDGERLRLPELDVMTELREPDMWFAVPGMYGGFRYVLRAEELVVTSWCRVVGGSEQTHRITADGYRMTASGHV
jgi:hypothetical protein